MTESAATSLEAVFVLWAPCGGHIGCGMSFGALLRASIVDNSDWRDRKLLLESKFELQRGLGLINSVKIVSIATCKSLLAPLVSHL